MAFSKLNGYALAGIVNVIPKQILCNENIEWLVPNQREQLITVTGINQRRKAKQNEIEKYFSFGMDKLLKELEWNPNSIDILLCVTQNAKASIPALSCKLQAKHNLSTETLCFDINLGCSGYVYGLQTIMALIQSIAKPNCRAILCCGDLSSLLIAPDDTSTQPIFSDGISVTAIHQIHNQSEMYFNTSTHGAGKDAIYTEAIGDKVFMKLNGIDVFHYSINYVPNHVKALLKFADTPIECIDSFIFHQANKLINNTLCKQLQIPLDKAPETLSLFGNTSSASIPITINEFVRQRLPLVPQKIVLCGFGVGFSIASALLTIENNLYTCTEEWE